MVYNLAHKNQDHHGSFCNFSELESYNFKSIIRHISNLFIDYIVYEIHSSQIKNKQP